jgi:hypothetical protein
MLFVAAAVAGGLFAAAASGSGPPDADTLTVGRTTTGTLLNVYAMRMAAVFTLTTVTIARRTQIVSRWLEIAGLATALVLLVGTGISDWVELLFPAWILALSIDILTARPGGSATPEQLQHLRRALGVPTSARPVITRAVAGVGVGVGA